MSEQQICANCGETGRGENEMYVETRDNGKRHVNMCDLCYPDFWDDLGPGEFITLEHTGVEVRQPYWRCEDCDSVYAHNLIQIVIDTDYDPEREAAICSFCRRKYKDRYKSVVATEQPTPTMSLRAALRSSNIHKARLQQGQSITFVEQNAGGYVVKYANKEQPFVTFEGLAVFLTEEVTREGWQPVQDDGWGDPHPF